MVSDAFLPPVWSQSPVLSPTSGPPVWSHFSGRQAAVSRLARLVAFVRISTRLTPIDLHSPPVKSQLGDITLHRRQCAPARLVPFWGAGAPIAAITPVWSHFANAEPHKLPLANICVPPVWSQFSQLSPSGDSRPLSRILCLEYQTTRHLLDARARGIVGFRGYQRQHGVTDHRIAEDSPVWSHSLGNEFCAARLVALFCPLGRSYPPV